MILARASTLFAALVLSACASMPGEPPRPADRVFTGGTIHTGTGETVEAVAVAEGRVLATGSLSDVAAHASEATETVDLAGAAMFPGFVDSHVHIMGVGQRERRLNLENVGSISALQEAVAAAAEDSEAGVIAGRGWIETHWPEARFPTRDDLDAVAPERPVVLTRADGHALVANSAALDAVGYDAATPDPEGGEILKDEAGRPNGMIIDAAMAPFAALVGEPDGEEREALYELGAEVLARSGWSGVHAMSLPPGDIAILETLAREGRLAVRVYAAAEPSGYDAVAAGAAEPAPADALVTMRAVKLYADGALGSRGAALLSPYSDRPGETGLYLMRKEAATAMMARALQDGVQLAIHAIGDAGNRVTLNWIEESLAEVAPEARAVQPPRWRIEHAQVVHPDDQPRFSELGVIASMQPSHAIGDLHFAPARLGLQRLQGAYAWRDLLDAGAVIAGGSDAPVERGEARIEFYAAAVRRDLDGFAGQGWNLDQAVSRDEALAMFTTAPALASFREGELGVIAPGYIADFSVFDADLMTVPNAALKDARPVMTVLGGEVVWRQPR